MLISVCLPKNCSMSYSRAVQPDRRGRRATREAGDAEPPVIPEPPDRPLRRNRRAARDAGDAGAAECLSLWKMDEMPRKFQGSREHFAKKCGDGLSVPEGTYRPWDASSIRRIVHGTHQILTDRCSITYCNTNDTGN
jgi:hypothetical protein